MDSNKNKQKVNDLKSVSSESSQKNIQCLIDDIDLGMENLIIQEKSNTKEAIQSNKSSYKLPTLETNTFDTYSTNTIKMNPFINSFNNNQIVINTNYQQPPNYFQGYYYNPYNQINTNKVKVSPLLPKVFLTLNEFANSNINKILYLTSESGSSNLIGLFPSSNQDEISILFKLILSLFSTFCMNVNYIKLLRKIIKYLSKNQKFELWDEIKDKSKLLQLIKNKISFKIIMKLFETSKDLNEEKFYFKNIKSIFTLLAFCENGIELLRFLINNGHEQTKITIASFIYNDAINLALNSISNCLVLDFVNYLKNLSYGYKKEFIATIKPFFISLFNNYLGFKVLDKIIDCWNVLEFNEICEYIHINLINFALNRYSSQFLLKYFDIMIYNVSNI